MRIEFDLTGTDRKALVRAISEITGAKAICKMSKEQTRISAKAVTPENEKYAFRCFLLRLGFIGNEYKAARKILLRSLSGNSAWKDGGRNEE